MKQWRPNVTVAAVIESAGRFLMVEEKIAAGNLVLNQPAGHLEPGESLLEAIRREVLEETTREFVPESVTGIYLWPTTSTGVAYLRVCFTGQCSAPVAGHTLDGEIVQNLWLGADTLRDQATRLRSPLVLRCIDDYLTGHRYDLSMLQYVTTS